MLSADNIAWLHLEVRVKGATPGVFREDLVLARKQLVRRGVLPVVKAARLHPMVRHVKDRDSGRPRRSDDPAKIVEGAHLLGDVLDPGIELASFAHEIIVEIDAKDGGDVRFMVGI